jgi:hypothetical protein
LTTPFAGTFRLEGIQLENSQVLLHFYDFWMNKAKVIEFRLNFQNLASISENNMN